MLKPEDSELAMTQGKAFVPGMDSMVLRSGFLAFPLTMTNSDGSGFDSTSELRSYVSWVENLFPLPVCLHSGSNSYVAARQYGRKNF